MKFLTSTLALAIAAIACTSYAADDAHTRLAIAVVDDADTRIELDIDDLGFDLNDLQEGESRSIVDKAGQAVLISRTAGGFTFDVAGRTIAMPALDDLQHGHVLVDSDHDENVEVHIVKPDSWAASSDGPGTMIVSSEPIDDATRAQIRTLLESAGHIGDVEFIDRDGAAGGSHKVIKKRIRTTR